MLTPSEYDAYQPKPLQPLGTARMAALGLELPKYEWNLLNGEPKGHIYLIPDQYEMK